MTPARRDLLLFAAALVIRGVHLLEVRSGPVSRYLFIDSAYYDEFARRLATGGGFPEGVFFMNVLYGVFVAALYSVFGDGAGGRLAVLGGQALLGAGAVLITYRIGAATGGTRVGWGAAVALIVFGPAIFYDGALLTPSLVLFLTTAATWIAWQTLSPASARPAGGGLALGAITGLLILARANHALLLPVWMGAYLVRRRRAGIVPAGLVLLAAVLVVLPVTVRNYAASGEWVPVTANGGMALWAGNHEGATGIYSQPAFLTNPVPEREAEDYRVEASRRAGREWTLAESSAFWTRETARRWREHPGSAARLALRKVRLYFHATESQTNLSYYFAMDHSRTLSVFRLHLGWVLPFAMIGLVAAGRRTWILWAPVAASLLTCVVFYVSSEYRHPVVPLLLVFAALGAERVRGWLRSGRPFAARALVVVGVLSLLVLVNYRDPFLARLQSRRVDYLNFGTLAATAGDLDEAERFLRRSIEIDPNWPISRQKLADLLQQQGRVREAGDTAGAPSARLQVAQRLFEEERYAEALAAFREIAATSAPADVAPALNNAGLCAMQLGDAATADSLFVAASQANPAYASPVIHRGRLSLAQGDSTSASARAREALRLAPEDGRAQRLLSRALGTPVIPE